MSYNYPFLLLFISSHISEDFREFIEDFYSLIQETQYISSKINTKKINLGTSQSNWRTILDHFSSAWRTSIGLFCSAALETVNSLRFYLPPFLKDSLTNRILVVFLFFLFLLLGLWRCQSIIFWLSSSLLKGHIYCTFEDYWSFIYSWV